MASSNDSEGSGDMFITALGIEESSDNSRPKLRKGQADIEDLEVDIHSRAKLPESVLFPSIVEGVLRDAWFVGTPGNSRLFWRQELTSNEFKDLSTDGYWWYVVYEVQKKLSRETVALKPRNPGRRNFTGDGSLSINTQEMKDLESDPIFGRMAQSYATIFKRIPQSKKDIFFSHFHEALAYSILACTTQAHPKQRSQFDDPEFRARMVDRCSVWTTGFRPHRVAKDHWVITAGIQTTTTYRGQTTTAGPAPSQSMKGSSRFFSALSSNSEDTNIDASNTPAVPVRAAHKITNSPFMQRYLKDIAVQPSISQTLKIALTQDGERQVLFCPRFSAFHAAINSSRGTPLMHGDEKEWRNLNPSAARTVAIARAKREATPTINAILQKSNERRKEILDEYSAQMDEMHIKVAEIKKKLSEEEADIDQQAKSMLKSDDLHEYAKTVQTSTMKRSDFMQKKMRAEKAARNEEKAENE